ncbi:hypothetical protein [Streptomyces anandii]|uniref:hypothetical protein n=1 Tax=Streptomyces anandii TaxID=285454 RepID=UPI00167A21D6|nr:hypothetical protein [Streptomyces anandii]GGY16587.1 hypothetical protein GCM10010510_72140 [Streptomyces anandii JCM 4720]
MCKEKKPGSRKECGSCRRMMIATRHLPYGTYLCQTCAPKRLQACCRCGRRRRANVLTDDGPVCGTCYASPARRCGICEQVAPIRVRAKGEAPGICYRCYVRREKLCTVCGRIRRGGGRICKACSFPDERPDYCSSCRQPADLLPGRRCPRCTLLAKVTSLLSDDGTTLDASLRCTRS